MDFERKANHYSVLFSVEGDTILVYPGDYKENVVISPDILVIGLSVNPDDEVPVKQIPGFPIIAFPVFAIMGIALVFMRRKE